MRDAAGEPADASIFCDCWSCCLETLPLRHVPPDEEVPVGNHAGIEAELDGAFPSASRRDKLSFVLAELQKTGPRPADLAGGARREKAVERGGGQILPRHVQQRARRRIGADDPPLVVDQKQCVQRAVEDGLELAIALAEHRLGLQPHGLLLVNEPRLLVHLLAVDDPIVHPRHPRAQGVIQEQGNGCHERQEPPPRTVDGNHDQPGGVRAHEKADPELGEVITPDAPGGLVLVQRYGHRDHSRVEQVIGQRAGHQRQPRRRRGQRCPQAALDVGQRDDEVRGDPHRQRRRGHAQDGAAKRPSTHRQANRQHGAVDRHGQGADGGTEQQDGAEGEDLGDRERHS